MNYTDKNITLFYGSDSGNTESIAFDIQKLWTICPMTLMDACEMSVADYDSCDDIIIGLSTWYDGELQSDFELFFDEFKTIDFSGKTVAMFGLGDQYGYDEWFVDGLGIVGDVILENGGKLIGMWPNEGYDFDTSKGLYDPKTFYGLALDEDNQMHETGERVERWIKQIEQEFKEIWGYS